MSRNNNLNHKGPIIRNVYVDDLASKKQTEPIYETFRCYLYKDITKGSFPVYQVFCNDKLKLYEKIDQLEQKYGLKTVKDMDCIMIKSLNDAYNDPVVIDPNTGEFINE